MIRRFVSTRLAAGLLFAAAPLAIVRANPPSYVSVAGQSSLTFSGTQQGERFTGAFRDFDAQVTYAPDQLGSSGITATIQMKSLDSKSPDRDAALAAAEWFDFAKYPVATFRTDAIRMTPAGPIADALLTIKSTTRRITFPFVLRTDSGKTVLDGKVTLDRLDFGIGAGEWADEGVDGHTVDVAVHLVLTAPGPPAAAKH